MQFRIDEALSKDLNKVVIFNFTKDEYLKIYNAQLTRLSQDKKFNIQGFRPGKLPLSVVEKYRGADAQRAAITKLQEKAVQEFAQTEDSSIAALVNSEVSFNEANSSEFLSIKTTFEYYPTLELKDFSDIVIKKPVINIDDSVDELLLGLRQQRSTFEETTEEAKLEDQVVCTINTVDSEGKQNVVLTFSEPTDFILGQGKLPVDIESQFIGKKSGETFSFEYLEKETELDNAEQAVAYTVTVNLLSVKKRVLPEVTNEFVEMFLQRKGDINDLKTEIRKNVEREVEFNTVKYIFPQIQAELIKKYEGTQLPEGVVKQRALNIEANQVERYNQIFGEAKTPEQKSYKEQFLKDIVGKFDNLARDFVLFDRIIDLVTPEFKLNVSNEDIDAFIDRVAIMYEYPKGYAEEVKKNPQQIKVFIQEIFIQKLVNAFLERCKVEDEAMSYTKLVSTVASLDR